MVAIPSSGTGHRGESAATTIVSFAPVDAAYLRITETDTPDEAPVWSIQQLRLYEAGPGVK
jgi:hypothetical protein